MVYNNRFIAVIKCKGKVLCEFSDTTVRLPFGSDYSILLKNKSNGSALVNVKVDGKDVLDNNSIIVASGKTTELKGFMKDSKVKNKFRFINKTKEISNYRGDFIEDGLVEITYRFEKYVPTVCKKPTRYHVDDMSMRKNVYGSCPNTISTTYCSANQVSDTSDQGITVPGRETNQNFVTGYIGDLEAFEHCIIIQLKGKIKSKTKRKLVKRPVITKTKLRCPTCGRRWKSSMTYCGSCSTYLH